MSPPNVLFVCADDLNAWVGVLGRHPGAKTPRIDALARSGCLFSHAYCAAPHCNPSRASVFTGLRPSTTGVYHGEALPAGPGTLCGWLGEAGYRRFAVGKVLHGHYDYSAAARTGASEARWLDTHHRPGLWDEYHPCTAEPLPEDRPLNGMPLPPPDSEELHWMSHFDWGAHPGAPLPDEEACDRALEFLGRRHERPFFCAVGFYRPHLPWYVPGRYFDLHPLDEVALPPVRSDDLDDVPAIPRAWARHPPDHERVLAHGQWRHAVRGYLASVSFCDALVGRLLDGLAATGRDRDTLVVLWGDNGFHLGEKLHWRKFTLWEEATRVPLVVRVPDGGPGVRVAEPVSLVDLAPTLLELCGVPVPPTLEGRSLVPHLAATPAAAAVAAPPALSTWGAGNHSARSRRWRYTRYADGSEELYDHARDPYEWTNLAGREALRPAIDAHRPWLDALCAAEDEGRA